MGAGLWVKNEASIDMASKIERLNVECRLALNLAGMPRVRPAGTDAFDVLDNDVAKDRDAVDQSIDESFPASDPLGQRVD